MSCMNHVFRWTYIDIKDEELIELISGPNVTGKYFYEDNNCPIDWEPSGFDFLSPCLQVITHEKITTNKWKWKINIIQILSLTIHLYLNFHFQEADALSRMPTMSNYTDFHEWLNNFIPGIYSDDFYLTPGNLSFALDLSRKFII